MSIVSRFEASASHSSQTYQKCIRPAPFSIRFTEEERARLSIEAAGAPLGSYIKAKVLGTEVVESKRRKVLAIKDREALAQALALLGRADTARNLQLIAEAASVGTLPVTPELESEVHAALADIAQIRRLVMAALGYRPGVPT